MEPGSPANSPAPVRPARSSYLLFLDECGTHDLRRIDPRFPVFLLLGLLVAEPTYRDVIVPRVKNLKREHFGTAEVTLHSRDIRRCDGPCRRFLADEPAKQRLYESLNLLFRNSRFRLFAVAVDKRLLLDQYLVPPNPYHLCLSKLLSLVLGPPRVMGANRPTVARIVAESRGPQEDRQLNVEYSAYLRNGLPRFSEGDVLQRRSSTLRRFFPPMLQFARKDQRVVGLELADLAAYPIARAVVNRDWTNPAVESVLTRLRGFVM